MITPEGLAALVYPALFLTALTPFVLIALLIKDKKDDQLW